MKKYMLDYTPRSVSRFMFYTLFRKTLAGRIFAVVAALVPLAMVITAVLSVVVYSNTRSVQLMSLSLGSVGVLVVSIVAFVFILRRNVIKISKANDMVGSITLCDNKQNILADIQTSEGKRFSQRIFADKIDEICLYQQYCYVFMNEGGVLIAASEAGTADTADNADTV